MTFDPSPTLEVLRARGIEGPIPVAMVLGTGLSLLADEVEEAIRVPYAALPGFPHMGVTGHGGQFVAGRMMGQRVAMLQGRGHYYESGNVQIMRPAIEVLKALGCTTLILTNAAGSLHSDWPPGSLALISDHINWSGTNPLIGETGDDRFVSMTDAYDPGLRQHFRRVAEANGIPLHEGTYMWFSGPSFETPAEIRMAARLGADLVGMSTVPETIFARRAGITVAALSIITNFGAGIHDAKPSHGETKEVALTAAKPLRRLLGDFMKSFGDAHRPENTRNPA